jgi:hypothetical protein
MADGCKSSLPLVVMVAALSLPVLYVLGLGPTEWLFVHKYLDNGNLLGQAVIFIYRPLIVLGNSCPPVQQFIIWYVGLWV